MRRALSSSAFRARQPLFELQTTASADERAFLVSRKRAVWQSNKLMVQDSKVIRKIFHCNYKKLLELRSECALRIAAALAKLQDPKSFVVQDLTFDNIMREPTISYTPELALIDLYNPLGIPPDTPKDAIPPIHDPSRVAKALLEADLTGSFYQVDSNEPTEWPDYEHQPRGGYIYPPRLHVDANPKLGRVTLTLPGATVQPLYNFFKWFYQANSEFKQTNEVVTLWARSHGFTLTPQTIALMVVGAMQSDDPFFAYGRDSHGWANVDYLLRPPTVWRQTVGSVQVNFDKVRSLPSADLDMQLVNFFTHWRDRLLKSDKFAFTVRNGRSDQLIPREYKGHRSNLENFSFLKANLVDPTKDFRPWRSNRIVIQDPFLVTHNHAELFSESEAEALVPQMRETVDVLRSGRPLPWAFGKHLAPPGSDAETRILKHINEYASALSLVADDRIPEDLISGRLPRSIRSPLLPEALIDPAIKAEHRDPRLIRGAAKRQFHTSSVALHRGRFARVLPPPRPVLPPTKSGVPRDGWDLLAKAPPKPEPMKDEARAPKKKERIRVKDQKGWGLSSPPAHDPSFWRPVSDREPLTLPTNAGSTNPVPQATRSTASAVPPARATKAGVAYKSVLSKPRGFHSSAPCAARSFRPVTRESGIDRSVHASRKQTLSSVERAIQKACGPEYRVELFGSTRYGISSPNSDLDMVILDPHRPYGFAPGKNHRLTPIYDVRNVAAVLKMAGFFITETLPKATVPIVKFKDPVTGHFADLNVNDRLGVFNSDLIKRYCELNPVLPAMIQYIKLWAKPLGFNSPSSRRREAVTFSSYALVMMTIGFLQHRGLLPNLQEGLPPLVPGMLSGTFWLHKPRILCCDVRYEQAEGWTPPKDVPVHILMHEWFTFWSLKFKYQNQMISIREGGCCPRVNIPGGFSGVMWNIDPFIRTKNITQNIGHKSISQFRHECKRWANMPEFELGTLPRPKNSGDLPEDEMERLMMPLGVRTAQWLPVEGNAFPLAWRDIPMRRKVAVTAMDSDEVLEVPVQEDVLGEPTSLVEAELSPPATMTQASDIVKSEISDSPRTKKQAFKPNDWVTVEDEFPLPWRDSAERTPAASDDEMWSEAESKDVLEEIVPSPDRDVPKPTMFMDEAPVDLEDQAPDYDPTLRFDAYGRLVEPKEPPKLKPTNPTQDEVGWGIR
ncbi:hypothetical protein B0H19DRAFT_1157812 [Mycena capillaripes]|nr:hypothetical protein B0H19DRAFT_1157812 [Mycena capillaripes]